MRIQEVVKQTQMSKRTIYYYIDEQLITPVSNTENGYYIFSEQDILTLKVVQTLRLMDFTIVDIRAVIKHPYAFHLYVQKQIHTLESEQRLLTEKITSLKELKSKLPLFINDLALQQQLAALRLPEKQELTFHKDMSDDITLVCMYLWGSFLHHIHMTEYRQYLWEKLQKTMVSLEDEHLTTFRNYIYGLSAQEIDTQSKHRYAHAFEVSTLTTDTMDAYIDKMLDTLQALLDSPKQIKRWKSIYFDSTRPSTFLFDSAVNRLVCELSPTFAAYCDNIHICCTTLYQRLHSPDGADLLESLTTKLDGYLNIEENHHGQIAALVAFVGSFPIATLTNT